MSLDHTTLQQAMRARLLTLSVCTTGTATLSATATGYARTVGSFLADGLAAGMEITPAGYATNTVDTITAVTALTLTTRNTRAAESAASGRTISVGLPAGRAFENQKYTPVVNTPYVEEQYIPGPEFVTTDSYAGQLEMRPMYSPRIYVPANTGIGADGQYADAIRRHFAPGTLLLLSSGEMLEVRDAAFCGQRAQNATGGWSTIPITIPFRVTTVTVPA